jgi:hypothetical protein
MGRSYERAQYRRRDVILSRDQLKLSDIRQPSGYARPLIEAGLPKQSLLVNANKKDGGQKLHWLGLSKKRGRGV